MVDLSNVAFMDLAGLDCLLDAAERRDRVPAHHESKDRSPARSPATGHEFDRPRGFAMWGPGQL